MGNTYQGIYIRDTLKDTGEIPSVQTPTYSPDIICYQNNLLTSDLARETYDKYICMSFINHRVNNIFVRARNISDKTLQGKVKAYYASLNILYNPAKWTAMMTASNQNIVNLVVDASRDVPPGSVAVVEEAFQLDYIGDSKQHYCMLAVCNNVDGSWIELPQSFSGDAELWRFLQQHPQMAYNNIVVEDAFYGYAAKNIQFGNYDNAAREFELRVTVTGGAESLKDCKMQLISTNAHCQFDIRFELDSPANVYAHRVKVPAHYDGVFTAVISAPNAQKRDFAFTVENMLVTVAEDNIPEKYLLASLIDKDDRGLVTLGDLAFSYGGAVSAIPNKSALTARYNK